MKIFILFAAALLCAVAGFAQSSVLGHIIDQQTGRPLHGATIQAGNTKAASGTDGSFSVMRTPDVHTIIISFTGYETQIVEVGDTSRNLYIILSAANASLSNVTVTGYQSNRRLLETAGSIAVLKGNQLQRGDNMDIMNALNIVPGVKMEAYSAGNYRISIRGSLVNNPWGIRNLRIYWNDIPFSSPDGTAQKSIDFDPALIGSVEVLKGPSGSMYGAGNGGVLLVKNSKAEPGQTSLDAGYTAGSYGFSRLQTSYKTAGENFNLTASVVRQRYDGYRENNWGNKDVINLFSEIKAGKRQTINFVVTHATGSLGIAGGLSKEQMDSMPRQAVAYNRDNKISVKKYDATVLGVSQTYQFSPVFSNITSVYGNFQTYDHPFGSGIYYNGYFKESLSGYGGRTKFVYSPEIGLIKPRFSIGGEYQYQHQFGNTFDVINDQPGTWPEAGDLYQDDIVRSTSAIVFAQAEIDLPFDIFLTAGASYTRLSYDILDLFKGAGHVDYSGLLRFPVKVSPRIGLVKMINDHLAVHGSMSKGYSPPPVFEINNYDGTLNKGIRPEDGTNYELGFRGSLLDRRLDLDITAYQMYLKNAIVPVAQANGTTAYRNAGKTNQKGLEGTVSYIVKRDPAAGVSLLKTWVSYTFNHYRFTDYKTQSYDYNQGEVITLDNAGKKVTGVVPNSVAAGIDMNTKPGVYFTASYYFYDQVPLNDANTYYADAYSLLNAKVGYKKRIGHIGVDIFAGVNNLTDTRYSSLLLYNADATSGGAPPAFYNPSADINYYGGINLQYRFK